MFFNLGTTGITEPEQLLAFIDRFARSIIDGAASQSIIAQPTYLDRHRMSAADNQRDVRFDLKIAIEKRREQMAFEMIDREIRFAETDRETFRNRCADHQRTCETGS